ncbi:RdgB/HAM1 family non-canonical purine NTP pyrophosphatase [Inquilinus sp. Marseille-Q2685]|uniref:RdgB/HAM1 family non-canonical purine NTP pyrophosphatase n=1 Tax=Inquilinus sp. Marseille-Q2685 TaxID=2866581 RepID=UPI001CE44713|nr:RdgB/HAM1 family non-canonical purine NTP pyrophosphatase [Inquilinus sp. Marseille-Q2685]
MTNAASPARRFAGDHLVIASHNKGKIPEIAALLEGRVPRLTSAADHGVPEPEETGTTFVANAELKARFVAAATGLPSLADDSGVSVTGLGGDPGIYSARWAEKPDGSGRDFAYAMEQVRLKLGDNPDRSARFVCALSLCWPDGHCETVEGEIRGRLVWPARGTKGFGYDPIFVPDGHDRTFGEMEAAEKHAMSHRADAFRKLVARCFEAG